MVGAVSGCGAVDDEEPVGRHAVKIATDRIEVRHQGGVRDECPSVRVVHEIREAAAAKERGERDDHETGPGSCLIELDHLDAVLEQRRDLVPLAQTECEQRVRDPVHSQLELRERDPLALEDDGRMSRPIARVAGEERVERHQRPLPQRTTLAAQV